MWQLLRSYHDDPRCPETSFDASLPLGDSFNASAIACSSVSPGGGGTPGAASYGQITCYDRRGDCYLDLAALGIQRAAA